MVNGDVSVQEVLPPGDGEGQGSEALVWDRAGVHTPGLRQGSMAPPCARDGKSTGFKRRVRVNVLFFVF